jgi:hypothetical protein
MMQRDKNSEAPAMRWPLCLFVNPNRPRNVSIIEGLELFREPKAMGPLEANQKTDEQPASTVVWDARGMHWGAGNL